MSDAPEGGPRDGDSRGGEAQRAARARQAGDRETRGSRWTRRRFLRIGLAGGALLGAGGLCARFMGSGYEVEAARARALVALSVKELVVVEAIIARILRDDGGDLPAPAEVEAGAFIDAFVGRLDERNAGDFRSLLHVVEHLAPLATGSLGRFTRLSGDAQDEVLRGLEESPVGLLRGGFDALRTLGLLAYFRHPSTWAAIGYDGPMVGRPQGGFR